jgi:hypothetical protein
VTQPSPQFCRSAIVSEQADLQHLSANNTVELPGVPEMRRYRLVATALAAVALLAVGCSSSPKPDAPGGPHRLADCNGLPQLRPAVVIVRCADDGMIARQLKWSGWGTPIATATGMATLNMCEFVPQDCAAGSYRTFPVVLIVSGSLRCPKGGPAYARIQTVLAGHDGGIWPQEAIDAITPRPCGVVPASSFEGGT